MIGTSRSLKALRVEVVFVLSYRGRIIARSGGIVQGCERVGVGERWC